MILISNICVLILVAICLAVISMYVVGNMTRGIITNIDVAITILLFLLLVGAVIPRFYVLLF